MENICIQRAEILIELRGVSHIASENFSGMKNEIKAWAWMSGKFKSSPVSQYFVARFSGDENFHGIPLEERAVGYVLWTEHGGLREGAYFELEQVAVAKRFQGNGIGRMLIAESFAIVKQQLKLRKDWLQTLKVTTDQGNEKAQKLYRETLGAEIENTVASPYHPGQREVEMFARFVKP